MNLEDLRVDFNAVLTSGGGSLSEKEFIRDFKQLIGKPIPYRELGHQNVKSLLQSLGGFNFSIRGGEPVISSRGDEKTAHIASLIARQKRKPGTKKVRARKSGYSYFSRSTKPAPLRSNVVRRRPAPTASVHSGIQRPAPPSRFRNPPLVPQRQPLESAKSRLEAKEAPAGRVTSFSSSSTGCANINVPEAKNLTLNENSDNRTRRFAPTASVHSGIQRPAPPPRFENPPIIPQRQPLVSTQSRLETTEAPAGRVSPRGSSINVPKAKNIILNENSNNHRPSKNSTSKWLQPKVKKVQASKPQSQTHEAPPETASISRSSGTSSSRPTNDPAQTVIFKSKIEELNFLGGKLGLAAPYYTEVMRKLSKKNTVYWGKVKVGEHLFSSYPEECRTPQEAFEVVAGIACDNLRTRLKVKPELGSKLADCFIEDRIFQIVKSKVNGIFEEAVVTAYQDSYGTSIPTYWLDVIRRSSKFSIESFNCTRTIIYPVSHWTLDRLSKKLEHTVISL